MDKSIYYCQKFNKYKTKTLCFGLEGGAFSFCKNDTKECQNNITHIRSMMSFIDIRRTELQGLWMRDVIRTENIIKIFTEKLKFNFEFLKWDVREFIVNGNCNKTLFERYIHKKISEIKDKKLYIIHLSVPNHVNLIYIDNNEKIYYYYEPHGGDPRCQEQNIDAVLRENNFKKNDLPENILKQEDLPLCYMYVLHFFIYLFIMKSSNNDIKKAYYVQNVDDVYIALFVRYMLKLCHEYNLVNDLDYYLLTSNTYKLKATINENTIINNILYKNSEHHVIKFINDNYKNISLNISFLYDIVDIYKNSSEEFKKTEYKKNIKIIFEICHYLYNIYKKNKEDINSYILNEVYLLLNMLPIIGNMVGLYIDDDIYILEGESSDKMLSYIGDNKYSVDIEKNNEIIDHILYNTSYFSTKQFGVKQSLFDLYFDDDNMMINLISHLSDKKLLGELYWKKIIDSDNKKMIKVFLDWDVDISLSNRKLYWKKIIDDDDKKMIHLFSDSDIDIRFMFNGKENKSKMSMPLIYACKLNKLEIVKLLSRNKKSFKKIINFKDGEYYTALMYACMHCNYDLVKLLLENGANPNISQRCSDGRIIMPYNMVSDFEDCSKPKVKVNVICDDKVRIRNLLQHPNWHNYV